MSAWFKIGDRVWANGFGSGVVVEVLSEERSASTIPGYRKFGIELSGGRRCHECGHALKPEIIYAAGINISRDAA